MNKSQSVQRGMAAQSTVATLAALYGMRALINPSLHDPWDLLLSDELGNNAKRVQVKLAYRRKGYNYLTADILKTTTWTRYNILDADLLAIVLPTFDTAHFFEWHHVYKSGRKSIGKLMSEVPVSWTWTLP